jgi:hypothetical protein
LTFDGDNNNKKEGAVATTTTTAATIANPSLAKLSIVILLATIAGLSFQNSYS